MRGAVEPAPEVVVLANGSFEEAPRSASTRLPWTLSPGGVERTSALQGLMPLHQDGVVPAGVGE